MEKVLNPEEEIGKELMELINQLQAKLQERHFDFLLVVGEKVSIADVGKMQQRFAMSAIVNESEVPVLPSALMGVCTQSQAHRKFVEDLMTFIVNMRTGGMKASNQEPNKNLAN